MYSFFFSLSLIFLFLHPKNQTLGTMDDHDAEPPAIRLVRHPTNTTQSATSTHRTKDFGNRLMNPNIDQYLNPWIPHNRLYILPQPFQRFLGYRKTPHAEPSVLAQWSITFIATLAGLCLVGGVYAVAPGIKQWQPPAMIASLGAAAVLDYSAVRSPLAQPRNAVVGHTLAALIGVCIAKLFMHSPTFFADYGWVAGAVGCACASLVMSMTNTVHPPGGATAVLASTNAEIIALGWMFVPLILLASLLMLCVALLVNNILRQYPVFWWTPEDVGRKLQRARDAEADAEGAPEVKGSQDGRKLEKQKSWAERYVADAPALELGRALLTTGTASVHSERVLRAASTSLMGVRIYIS